MNFSNIQNLFTLACAAGGLACFAAIVLYSVRHVLRELLDQLYAASRLTKLVVFLAFAGATLFGGAKHGSTNEPPADVSGDSSPTNDPPPVMMVGRAVPCAPQSTNNANSLCGDCGGQGLTALPSWHARGAYCDWKRIDFPDTFAFPSGTNLLTGVTLMSYGELRVSLRGPVVANVFATSNQLLTTNQLTTSRFVSMEPNASSVNYGLTSSNSFVFVWENACVNREATNRINAAIELFQSGDMCISTLTTNRQPLTTLFIPVQPPEGYVGAGQDENWATNALPDYADAIAEKGYDTWLEEDYVGVNEPNGHYQLKVTVSSIPGDTPCYLVCGPHKVIVTHPGTYCFPMEVFETYKIRTYPVALPLAFTSDDGYRGNAPNLLSAPPPMPSGSPSAPQEYEYRQTPRFVIMPNVIPLSQARNTLVTIWCNVADYFRTQVVSLTGNTSLRFVAPSLAEIESAQTADLVMVFKDWDNRHCYNSFSIYDDTPPEPEDDPDDPCDCGYEHNPHCTCYGCLYEGVCFCGHELTEEELEWVEDYLDSHY